MDLESWNLLPLVLTRFVRGSQTTRPNLPQFLEPQKQSFDILCIVMKRPEIVIGSAALIRLLCMTPRGFCEVLDI